MVMATLGRKNDLKRLFDSLSKQTYTDFELIIVDQNVDGLIDEIVSVYKTKFYINHIKTRMRGLSRARNIGIDQAKGDIICFPDDDCWLEMDTLQKVNKEFMKRDIDAITIRAMGPDNRPLSKKELTEEEKVNRSNIWYGAMSISIFVKTKLAKVIGGFDESLGVGAGTPYGAGEETDFLYRLLDQDKKIIHFQSINIYHPKKDDNSLSSDVLRRRYHSYGYGIGYVLKKNNVNKKMVFSFFLRPVIGSLLSIIQGNIPLAQARYNSAVGRIQGYFSTVDE